MRLALFAANSRTAQDLPNLSQIMLTPQDFPPGFFDMSSDLLGMVPGQQVEVYSSIENIFGSMSLEHYQMIWGFTVLLATKADQDHFAEEDGLLDGLKEMDTGAGNILELKDLSDLKEVGDAMAAMTMVIDVEGAGVRMDTVVFHRDVVGAVVFVCCTDGELPIVPIDAAASKLDYYTSEALSANDWLFSQQDTPDHTAKKSDVPENIEFPHQGMHAGRSEMGVSAGFVGAVPAEALISLQSTLGVAVAA